MSTVPSFHETFFFLRLSCKTRVCGGGGGGGGCCCEVEGDGDGFSRVRVVVTDDDAPNCLVGRAISQFLVDPQFSVPNNLGL